jgi:hypothetical protein
MGLPLPGSPLVFSIPTKFSIELAWAGPHPFGKRRGGCSGVLASEGAEVLPFEPTSLSRGEGLATVGLFAIGGEMGWEGKVVVEEEWKSTNENQPWCGWCCFKTPLSPPKITFDIGSYPPDNKIKSMIIFEVFYEFSIQNFKEKYAELNILFKKYLKMGFNTVPVVNSIL